MATAAPVQDGLEQRRAGLTLATLRLAPAGARERHAGAYACLVPARDRHGRGPRGPLVPARLPGARTRSERFADVVVAAVDRLEPRWGPVLGGIDVEVLDVPPGEDPAMPVTLATHRPPHEGRPAAIVVHRRAVLARAPDRPALVDLVRDLVAEELAVLLGTTPEALDPDYG